MSFAIHKTRCDAAQKLSQCHRLKTLITCTREDLTQQIVSSRLLAL